jgi:Replication factor-A C terminal domain
MPLESYCVQHLGTGGAPAYVKLVAALTSVRQNPMTYPACMEDFASRKCQKKMQDQGDGTFFCERCNKSSARFERALLVALLAASNASCGRG